MRYLVFVGGPRKGVRVPLDRKNIRLGRDRSNEVYTEDINCSRWHAEVFLREGSYCIRDLSSTNGTYVNGYQVEEAVLGAGDHVSIGETVLLFEDKPRKDATSAVVFSDAAADEKSSQVSLDPSRSQFLDPRAVLERPPAAERLARLYRFISEIAPILNERRLLEAVLDCVFEAMPADRGFIMLVDQVGALQPALMRLKSPSGRPADFQVSRRMTEQVLSTGQSVLSADTLRDGRFKDSGVFLENRVSSFVCAPLKSRDRMLGLLYADTLGSTAPLDEEGLEFLTAMALLAGSQFANAKLYGELLNSTERNQSILRCLRSGVVVTGLGGKVEQLNEAACEILGVGEGEIVGREFSSFDAFLPLWKVMDETRQSGVPADRQDLVVNVADGSLPLGISTSLLRDHDNRVCGIVANFRNLSVIKKLSEQVRMSQQLAVLGEMAAGVAHEIRNPLNSIRGFAQLLEGVLTRADGQPDSDTGSSYIKIIVEEVDRMNQLVSDLLDFARQHELTMARTDIAGVVTDIIEELSPEITQANVTVETKIEPELPPVMVNVAKMKQVFVNLIRNAIQAMTPPVAPAERNRRFVASVRQATGPDGRSAVEMAFSDTGVGMNQAELARAFEPFFTTRDRGTGLGLAICRKIIQQHGGRIDCESQAGVGTVMRVRLPSV